jgi:hypothetical protein
VEGVPEGALLAFAALGGTSAEDLSGILRRQG